MLTGQEKLKKARRTATILGAVTVLSLVCGVFAIHEQQLTKQGEKMNVKLAKEDTEKLNHVLDELKNCQAK